MPSSRSGGRRSRGVVHWLALGTLLLLGVELVVFTVSTLPGVRAERAFSVPLDGWLQGGAYVTAAILAGLRTLVARSDRGLWIAVSAALAARAFAFVVYIGFVRTMRPPPVPSVADVGWLAMCVLLMVALVRLAQS